MGRRLAELRRESGKTQHQTAEAMDCSDQYLRNLEAGRENLTLRKLVELANFYGVEIRDLMAPAKTRSPG